MTRTRLIQGTGEELLSFLDQNRHRRNLALIIPEEQDDPISHMDDQVTIRNGVPLFPTQGAKQVITMDLVRRLAEEE